MDRNTTTTTICTASRKSLSARRAWIEITTRTRTPIGCVVALRKESVDRNLWWGVRKAVGSLVALRKESVDRNYIIKVTRYTPAASLSARRAWIEICGCPDAEVA